MCLWSVHRDDEHTLGAGLIIGPHHSSLQTIKCLFIVPNPESALDEEAGKLLLEEYDSYFKMAKLMTGIHATPKVRT